MLYDYQLLMQSYALKMVDQRYNMAIQAWYSNSVGATNRQGKPLYKKFTDFFDYEKEVQRIKHPQKHKRFEDDDKIFALMAQANMKGGQK